LLAGIAWVKLFIRAISVSGLLHSPVNALQSWRRNWAHEEKSMMGIAHLLETIDDNCGLSEQLPRDGFGVRGAKSAAVAGKKEHRRLSEILRTARGDTETNPSEAQQEAGNYRKGKVKLHGLEIRLENPKGSTRSGTDPDGNTWSIRMRHDYGYIARTEGKDGDQIDVFIGDTPETELVFCVNQMATPDFDTFDEHKFILGAVGESDAREIYLANYDEGWKGLGSIYPLTIPQFKWWLANGDTKKEIKDGTFAAKKKAAGDRTQSLFDRLTTDGGPGTELPPFTVSSALREVCHGQPEKRGSTADQCPSAGRGPRQHSASQRVAAEVGAPGVVAGSRKVARYIASLSPATLRGYRRIGVCVAPIEKQARDKCPGCGRAFPEGEPYPDVDMCEVCERYGPPKKEAEAVPAYKLFRTLQSDPGALYPLFINKTTPVPQGEWVPAENVPTPGFAPRPGWHAGDLPTAPHLRSKKEDRIMPGRVWTEVELPANVDWQPEADASPTGDVRDQVPEGGHYRKERPKNQGGEWLIGGGLRVLNQLSDDEVSEILRRAGEEEAAEKERREPTKEAEDDITGDLGRRELDGRGDVGCGREGLRGVDTGGCERSGNSRDGNPVVAGKNAGERRRATGDSPASGNYKRGAGSSTADSEERPPIVAVDLDGTLAEEYDDFDPEVIGAPRPGAAKWVQQFADEGAKIIIYTCRDADDLVKEWAEEHSIPVDYINENPWQPPGTSDKMFADIYVDNRGVRATGPWSKVGPTVLRLLKAGSALPDLHEAIDSNINVNVGKEAADPYWQRGVAAQLAQPSYNPQQGLMANLWTNVGQARQRAEDQLRDHEAALDIQSALQPGFALQRFQQYIRGGDHVTDPLDRLLLRTPR
jgi:hypothetical protein